MSFDWATLLVGGGGGLLGWIGGAIQQSFLAASKHSDRVEKRLEVLEKQVEECRKRDGHIAVLSLGLKMIVPEMLAADKSNPVLRHVTNALSALPIEDSSFDGLIAKLNEIP